MHKEIEFKLVEACKQGDRRAMDKLVREYERPVYNAAYRMLGNPDDAADIAQTTFIKAFEKLDSFNPRYRFFSWIYRITVNESINLLKRNQRSGPLAGNEAAAGPGPADIASAGETSREVQAALMALQEDYRAVIVLKYFTGCSYREMGDVLQIPEKTVKSRLFTARQQMKELLQADGLLQG